MAISSTTSKHLYSGDGSTVSFPINFVFWADTEIKAVLRDSNGDETTWVDGTQYTLTGGGGSTGTLTVETSPTDYTPQSGEKLLIKSIVSELQSSSLPLGGAFPSTTVEQMVDIVTRLVQQHSEEIARSVVLKETTSVSGIEFPEPGAGELIRYNSGGDALETVAAGDLTVAIDTLLGSLANNDFLVYESAGAVWKNLTPANARTAMAVPGTAVANTFTADQTVQSSDAGATAGPDVIADRASASQAASDFIGRFILKGRDDAGTPAEVIYGALAGQVLDPSAGAEDAAGILQAIVAGALTDIITFGPGVQVGAPTGGDQGADSLNASALYIDGVSVDEGWQIQSTTDISTGAASYDITSVPSWVREIQIFLESVSTSGTSIPMFQIGDSGGIETTSYISTGSTIANAVSPASGSITSGFAVSGDWTAARSGQFSIKLRRATADALTWFCEIAGNASSGILMQGHGAKALSAALDRFRLTTVGGSDTFDAGTMHVRWR